MKIVPIIALQHPEKQQILLAIRPEGKPLAGYYEFPGGKMEANELPPHTIIREAYEELGIVLQEHHLMPVTFVSFFYQEEAYLLLMYYCHTYQNTPYGKEGQILEWACIDTLTDYKMPEFNQALIPYLKNFLQKMS